MLIGMVCWQITILVSIPLSIVVLMYICSVSSGASRHIMLLLYSVLHCAYIQLLKHLHERLCYYMHFVVSSSAVGLTGFLTVPAATTIRDCY